MIIDVIIGPEDDATYVVRVVEVIELNGERRKIERIAFRGPHDEAQRVLKELQRQMGAAAGGLGA